MVMPPILEAVPSQATIRDAEITRLRAGIAGWTGEETDPLYKAVDNRAGREVLLREYFNARARGLLPDYAEGENLDAIVARVGMERNMGETDAALRTRLKGWIGQIIPLGSEAAYTAHARSASPLVTDVGIEVNAATRVISVFILTTENADGEPETATRTAVQTYMRDSRRVLLGWTVNVPAPTITPFTVSANVVYRNGGDRDAVIAAARESVYAYLRSVRTFGRSVYRSAIVGALQAHADAVSASVTVPAADIITAQTDKHTVHYCPTDAASVVLTASEEV